MITIIADRHGYASPPPDAHVVAATTDYVRVRQRIRQALNRGDDITVYVTDPVVMGWLGDLQHYPGSHVTWRLIDPADDFARIFGTGPTGPFTPQLITALRLDTLSRPPDGAAADPLAWVLGHRLDPVWQYVRPPANHAVNLVEWAAGRNEAIPPDMVPLVQAQLERWSMDDQIYQALRPVSIREDAISLLTRWALQRYDAGWRREQPWGGLQLIDGDSRPDICITALRSQHQAINDYWSRRMAGVEQSVDSITAALSQMSGLSDAEISVIATMVERCPTVLDERLLDAVRRRFMHLPTADDALRIMAEHVAPLEPALPDANWPLERWLSWATQQYMPYFAWVIRTRRPRDHQQACALPYGDWLFAQYPAWLNDEQSPVLLSQYRRMRELLERDERTIIVWLVVDGLTWWQGELLRAACERHGLHPQAHLPGIAALPSITSISKRALVTGLPTIDLAQPTIAEAARVQLRSSEIPASVGYSLPEAIQVMQQRDDLRCFLVLFNTIDVLAHQTNTFTDNAGIRGYLEDLARNLGRVRRICEDRGRRLHVLIGSDHGSTLLPEDAASIPPPQAVKEIEDTWEPELPGQEQQKPGTRAAVTDLDHIPAIDRHLWYDLDRDRFQLDRHYLVPRGYRYIKRRPTGWTHGGLTPEETIVPLMHLTPERPTVLRLVLELQGSLRPGVAGTVTAVLLNPNRFPLHDVTLTMSGGPDAVTVEHIAALGKYEVSLAFPAITTSAAELQVSYQIRYHVFGTPQSDEDHATIALRRLKTEDTSLEDLFN